MTHLRELDEVAYVRFASVYRSFRDIDEFLPELGKLARARAERPRGGPVAERRADAAKPLLDADDAKLMRLALDEARSGPLAEPARGRGGREGRERRRRGAPRARRRGARRGRRAAQAGDARARGRRST